MSLILARNQLTGFSLKALVYFIKHLKGLIELDIQIYGNKISKNDFKTFLLNMASVTNLEVFELSLFEFHFEND